MVNGVVTGPALASAAVAASWPPRWRVLSEFGYFAALALVIGGTFTCLMVVRPALRLGAGDDVLAWRRRVARLLARSGPLVLVAAYLQLAGRLTRADPGTSFASALSPPRLWRFMLVPAKPGEWVSSGALILAQNVLLVAAVLGMLAAGPARNRLWAMAVLVVALGVASSVVISVPTAPGAVTLDDALGRVLVQMHILGACTWLGGLAALAALVWPRRGVAGAARLFRARVWQRFSVVALCAVGAILLSGPWLAWKHVGSPAQLATTAYGRFLLVKLILVVAMVSSGGYNQLVLTPRLAREEPRDPARAGVGAALRRFPVVVTVEATLGACVLLIVPFLSGSARAQADGGALPTVDGGILAWGLLLVVCLGGSLTATHRVSRLRVRHAQPAGPPGVVLVTEDR